MDNIKLVVFYSTQEIDIKDIESEIFTENREQVNFFLFHNKDMHFNKALILQKVLLSELHNIKPEFDFIKNSLVMTKRINNFNFIRFDQRVDFEYYDYLSKINYRIDCIFQTFSLFLRLYADRNIIFVFPIQIRDNFFTLLGKNNLECKEITKINDAVRRLETLHWINYYSKTTLNPNDEGIINYKKVTHIYLINSN